MFKFSEKIEIIVAFLLLSLIFILKYPILNLPYSWDVMNYVIPAAQHIYENGFAIFFWNYSNGHPPFYFILLGFVFKLFGSSQVVSHLVTVFFSFLAVYFTYLLGKLLFNRKVGITAALLMFFYPTFFSYSGMSYLAIPLAALTIMSIYYFIKGNKLIYVVVSSSLALTTERAVVIPVALLFYEILKNKRINIKKDIILSIPVIIFGLWLISNKIYYGYFMYPISISFLDMNIIKIILNSLIILKSLFFDYYKWILTSFIILSCFSIKLLKFNKKLLYNLITSFAFFLVLFNLPNFSIYFESIFSHVSNYFLIVRKFSLLFSLLFFILLSFIKNFIVIWNNKKFYPLYLVFIFAFLSYIPFVFSPRYSLPIYPIIFIFFAYSLVKIFKKYFYIPILIILFIFVLQYTGQSSSVGFVLENNMEYSDSIKVHQIAAEYLQNEFPNSVILASFPQSLELQYSYLGYVKKPLNVVSIPTYPGLITKNYTIFLNPNIYNKTIDLNLIDVVYYSGQEYKTRYSRELNNILNKTLVRKFELNNKTVEIYKINKNIVYPNYTMYMD